MFRFLILASAALHPEASSALAQEVSRRKYLSDGNFCHYCVAI